MYRIITLKNNKLYNVAYSKNLIYSRSLTKADGPDYKIIINKCTYISDINDNIIFENDIVEDENQEQYLVEYDQKRWILKSKKKSINELDNKKYKIIKNIYLQL